jgi:3-oxosteroid 1-dehydrogenase
MYTLAVFRVLDDPFFRGLREFQRPGAGRTRQSERADYGEARVSDTHFDFVIVGSGAGGVAAAIKAKLLGLRPLLLEKTALIGGSSIMSGGVLWMPNNPLMQREGVADSREAGLSYMANFVGPEDLYSAPARREAFVDTVEDFITTMEAQGMKYRRCDGYSDYYANLPGGNAASRSLEAELFDANRLGDWKHRVRLPNLAMPVATSEVASLINAGVNLDGKVTAAKFAGRMIWSKLTGQALRGSGGALQGRMIEIALKLGVDIWTEAALVDLDLRDGRVEGVHIDHAGRAETIRAPRGVLISAGGFSHNEAMRQKHQRHPISNAWSFSNPGDTGEAIEAMVRAGAGLALMEEAWWASNWKPYPDPPAKPPPAADTPRHAAMAQRAIGMEMGLQWQLMMEFSKPHTIVVDSAGRRFVNEANSYMEMGRAIYERHATTPAIPAWAILDMQARRRYFFGLQPPGRIPPEWVKNNWVKVDDTLAGLARQCGIDPAGLEATVARYNSYCEAGIDLDYGRGGNAYNRYYGDPTAKPNPCLGPISEPPFWAAATYPGDVGTCGGVTVNERAEVMRGDGGVIEGLYATGNCSAPLCGPYYVGAGQSIGSSSVFGYIAAQQAAR